MANGSRTLIFLSALVLMYVATVYFTNFLGDSQIFIKKFSGRLSYNFCGNSPLLLKNEVTNPSRFLTRGVVQSPSVYSTLGAGLGNQLFHFACGYALARKYNLPLFIAFNDPNANYTFLPWERAPISEYFHIPLHSWNTATRNWTFSKHPVHLPDFKILSGAIPANEILHPVDGCQSHKFFEPYQEEIQEMYKLKADRLDLSTQEIVQQIQSFKNLSPSVCVHIRRGDFSLINRTPASFYHNSIEFMKKMLFPLKPTFFFFSDDTNITRLQMEFGTNFFNSTFIRFVSNGRFNSLQEFHLFTKCEHSIIPNSSFSWWASYINSNKDKIVIAAHHNSKWIGDFHKSVTGNAAYYVFQFKYLYYPNSWYTFDPFN